ncbi:MAG: lipocalin [Cyclobacteriaceae bacterium]|nr:lipocalin [Cyclobacteriaceae bacterium]
MTLGVTTYGDTSTFSKYALSNVDISRYAGTWKEVSRIPNGFQGDMADVKATYSANPDGSIRVFNEGTSPTSGYNSIVGTALIPQSPRGILKVSFFYPFVFSDYYVVALDEANYSYAMVGGPVPDILWILSREKPLSAATQQTLKTRAREMGYNVDSLKEY